MQTGEENSGEKKKSIGREVIGMVLYIAAVLAAVFVINTFVAQRTEVNGMSMYPTLNNGDNLITDKISYRFVDPKRFDIIVFPYQHEENTYFIKRIIGLPGETIQITDGAIYIDGEVLEEDYGREVMSTGGSAEDPITLGEDEYFVLGDNRNNSKDSRDPMVGTIHRKDIVGRAFIRIWPFSKFGILKHQ